MWIKISVLVIFVVSFLIVTPKVLSDVCNDAVGINRPDVAADPTTKSDIEITREIRRRLIADKNLSLYAHNVKIMTADGRVTLRGPVRSREEETEVVKFAQSAAGPSRVIDSIQVSHASHVKKASNNKGRIL